MKELIRGMLSSAVARELEIAVPTVRLLEKRGELRPVRVGHIRIYDPDEVAAVKQRRSQGGKGGAR